MYNINKIEKFITDKKVLIFHGSNDKNYKYYIKEINDDIATIIVNEPIETSIYKTDYQIWSVNSFNLLSRSKKTNEKATWGKYAS